MVTRLHDGMDALPEMVNYLTEIVDRPELNMLKICIKCFEKFSLIMLFQCSHYAPNLVTFVTNILISECSIRVFHCKLTVLLESINVKCYVERFIVVISFH